MTKLSIATTVDEEDRRSEKRGKVEGVKEEDVEINKGNNWMYLVIGVAYMMECGEKEEEGKILMEMLRREDISMEKCKNVEEKWGERMKGEMMVKYIGQAVEYAKQVWRGNKKSYEKDKQILSYIKTQPQIVLSILVLIRSICLLHGQDIINESPQQYLGNQLSLIADYSISPSYKIISIISKIFNYSIKISNINHQQLSQSIIRNNPSRQIMIKKFSNRIFFNIKIISLQLNNQVQIQQMITTPYISTKSVQQHQLKPQTEQKIHHHMKQQQPISKELYRKQSVNSIRSQRVKICVSCGQARKPEQRFCQCKKRKQQCSTIKS